MSSCCCCVSCLTLRAQELTAARQASLSFTTCLSLFKFTSTESVMPSNHLILCHPFSSCPLSFPESDLFQWVGSSHQMAKVLDLQLQPQSFQWISRVDFLSDGLVWSPRYPRDSHESSPVPQSEGINFRCSIFFTFQLSHSYKTTGKPQLWLYRPSFVNKVRKMH